MKLILTISIVLNLILGYYANSVTKDARKAWVLEGCNKAVFEKMDDDRRDVIVFYALNRYEWIGNGFPPWIFIQSYEDYHTMRCYEKFYGIQ